MYNGLDFVSQSRDELMLSPELYLRHAQLIRPGETLFGLRVVVVPELPDDQWFLTRGGDSQANGGRCPVCGRGDP